MTAKKTKTISTINMKGGVGKTTLTANLAWVLADIHDKDVLVIDLDPQFNLTQYMLPQENFKKYVKDVDNGRLRPFIDVFRTIPGETPSISNGTNKESQPVPLDLEHVTINISSDHGKLDLIPSHLELMEISSSSHGTENRLKKFLQTHAAGKYDYIIIDCPPTMSVFTLSAYKASDGILIPIKPDYLSSLGLPLLQRALKQFEIDSEHKAKELGIVFTMIDKRPDLTFKIMDRVAETMGKKNTYVFENGIRYSSTISGGVADNVGIHASSRSRNYQKEITDITEGFLSRVKSEFGNN